MSVELYAVPPSRLSDVWPAVEPLLHSAMARGGEMPMHELKSALFRGQFVLWLVWGDGLEAAVVTEIAETIAGRVCCIVACGGKDRKRWLHLLHRLESYARAEGCARMRIYGRKGWMRALPDYKAVRVVLERELN